MSSAPSEPAARETAPLEPTRDPRVTLSDLVDVLLNRGVYLDLDVIIGVADIPLIGLNLKATLAGMETMLEYGMMREWDERTRAWVQRSLTKDLNLSDGEDLLAKSSGGYLAQRGESSTWRPCGIYLTTERLLAFRREPREVLWQVPLSSIRSAEPAEEVTIGGEARERLHVTTTDDETHLLSATSPRRLAEVIAERGHASHIEAGGTPDAAEPVTGEAWWYQRLAGRTEWRGGTASLQSGELIWTGVREVRPAVRIPLQDIREVGPLAARTPLGERTGFTVATESATHHFGSHKPDQWVRLLRDLCAPDPADEPHSSEIGGTS